MEPWIQMIITIVCSIIASSGFWAYLTKINEHALFDSTFI